MVDIILNIKFYETSSASNIGQGQKCKMPADHSEEKKLYVRLDV